MWLAYSLVLARTVEYEADLRAAEVTSPGTLAGALVATELRGRVIAEKFWPGFFERHAQDVHPPATAFIELATIARDPLPGDSRQWLAAALERPADIADSHPSIAQRLAALGYREAAARNLWTDGIVQENAADVLLGDRARDFREQLGLLMQSDLEPGWQQRSQRRDEGRRSMNELDSVRLDRPLDASELWTYALAKAENDGADAAVPHMEAVIAADPAHPDANLWLGQVLTEKGDEAGIALLDAASTTSPIRAYRAAEVASKFYESKDPERAAVYRKQAEHAEGVLQAANAERQTISTKDSLEPHNLDPRSLLELRMALSHLPVERAYLAKKKVWIMPEVPFFLLVIERRKPIVEFDAAGAAARLLNDVRAARLGLPGQLYMYVVRGKASAAFPRLRASGGVPVYQRS
jgi:hypothetical protein